MKTLKNYETPRIDAEYICVEKALLALSTEHTAPVQDEIEDEIIEDDSPFTF